MGWVITFMFLCTHRHTTSHNLFIFFAVLQTHDHLPVGWGGVGQGGVIIPNMSEKKTKPPTRHVMLVGYSIYIYIINIYI